MKIVTAAIISKNGKYLVAKRKAGGVVGGKWEFPGGKKEFGESLQECLRRELREELGIEAQVGVIFDECMHNYKSGKLKLFAYNINKYAGKIQLNEHDEIKWVTITELNEYQFIGNDVPIIKKLIACN